VSTGESAVDAEKLSVSEGDDAEVVDAEEMCKGVVDADVEAPSTVGVEVEFTNGGALVM
jgi:hypothetical protein